MMSAFEADQRSPQQRARDEQVAASPKLPSPDLQADASAKPVETFLDSARPRLMAVMGVVESRLIRPVDPAVKFPEHARVIIVAIDAS